MQSVTRIFRLSKTTLDALEANQTARDWMTPVHHNAYLIHKRGEAASMAGLTEADQKLLAEFDLA